jgi:hypothetical protein
MCEHLCWDELLQCLEADHDVIRLILAGGSGAAQWEAEMFEAFLQWPIEKHRPYGMMIL